MLRHDAVSVETESVRTVLRWNPAQKHTKVGRFAAHANGAVYANRIVAAHHLEIGLLDGPDLAPNRYFTHAAVNQM